MHSPIVNSVLTIFDVAYDIEKEEWLEEHQQDAAEIAGHNVNQVPFVSLEDCDHQCIFGSTVCGLRLPDSSKLIHLLVHPVFLSYVAIVLDLELTMLLGKGHQRSDPSKEDFLQPPGSL